MTGKHKSRQKVVREWDGLIIKQLLHDPLRDTYRIQFADGNWSNRFRFYRRSEDDDLRRRELGE